MMRIIVALLFLLFYPATGGLCAFITQTVPSDFVLNTKTPSQLGATTCAAAAAAIGSTTPTVLILSSNLDCSTPATFTSNITIQCQGGMIDGNQTASALTILGPIDCPGAQLFTDFAEDTVVFTGNTHIAVYEPAWWGIIGDGTNETLAQQAMWTQVPAGAVIQYPPGNFVFSSLVRASPVTIRGTGWRFNVSKYFGDADWALTTRYNGTILRSTATSGVALDLHGPSTWQYNLRDFMLVGPGSGTSIGIRQISDNNNGIVRSVWSNLAVANFSSGIELNFTIGNSYENIILYGNTTSLTAQKTADGFANLNTFKDLTAGYTSLAVSLNGAQQNVFIRPLVENLAAGGKGFVCSAATSGSCNGLTLLGPWFEHGTDGSGGLFTSVELNDDNTRSVSILDGNFAVDASIVVNGGKKLRLSGNTFTATSGNPIQISADSTDTYIENNEYQNANAYTLNLSKSTVFADRNCHSPNATCWQEEFQIGSTAGGSIGQLPWNTAAIGAALTPSRVTAEANHEGIIRLTTGSVAGQGGFFGLSTAISLQSLIGLGSSAGWDNFWVFRLGQTATTRFYLADIRDFTSAGPLDYIGLRYDTDTSAFYSDTNFQFACSATLPSKTIAAAGVPGVSRASNVVTVTTTTVHGFSAGQLVRISGVTDTAFNGTFAIVDVPTTTTFTYAQTAGDATSGSGTAEAANDTITDSTIAADTGWHVLHKWSDIAGTVNFSLDGGAIQSISSNCPTGGLTPGMQLVTTTGTGMVADVDYYSLYRPLSRW